MRKPEDMHRKKNWSGQQSLAAAACWRRKLGGNARCQIARLFGIHRCQSMTGLVGKEENRQLDCTPLPFHKFEVETLQPRYGSGCRYVNNVRTVPM